MTSERLRRAWMFGSVLSFSVVLVSCSGPVPAGTRTPGGSGSGTGTGTGSGSGSGTGSGSGSGTGSAIDLDPGATSTRVSTGTEITEQHACAVSKNDATKQADILLVLDRSSSMNSAIDSNNQCNTGGGGGGRRDASATTCQSRWTVVQSTLKQVLASSAGSMNWGLLMFSTPLKGSCVVDDGVQVDIGAGNATKISTAISSAGTAQTTPTRKAVNVAVKYLQGLTGPETKSILLATDGQPNCANDTDSSGDDVVPTTDAIKAAAAAGFKVYILGIGPETNAEALNGFANAGGTEIKDVSGPGKNYFAALSAEELSKHFESIVGSVASCTFKLTLPKSADLSNVVVEFDGDKSKRATRDTTRSNGWDFTSDDHTVIQLYGPWCDGLMNGTYKSAKVLIGCKDQPIP